MQKLDRMLAQLNADDYPRKWREKAREVGAHSWLLLLQLATRDLPIPEPDRFEPTGANREADWISFGGMAGFIRVYPKMPPIRIARGFGAGLYRELRKARLLPAGLDGEFSRAFEFFVRERMGRTPIRALDKPHSAQLQLLPAGFRRHVEGRHPRPPAPDRRSEVKSPERQFVRMAQHPAARTHEIAQSVDGGAQLRLEEFDPLPFDHLNPLR